MGSDVYSYHTCGENVIYQVVLIIWESLYLVNYVKTEQKETFLFFSSRSVVTFSSWYGSIGFEICICPDMSQLLIEASRGSPFGTKQFLLRRQFCQTNTFILGVPPGEAVHGCCCWIFNTLQTTYSSEYAVFSNCIIVHQFIHKIVKLFIISSPMVSYLTETDVEILIYFYWWNFFFSSAWEEHPPRVSNRCPKEQHPEAAFTSTSHASTSAVTENVGNL